MHKNLNYISEFPMTQLRLEDLKEGDRVQVTFEGTFLSGGYVEVPGISNYGTMRIPLSSSSTITRLPPKGRKLEVGEEVSDGMSNWIVRGTYGQRVWCQANSHTYFENRLVGELSRSDGTPITVEGE